LNDAAGWYLPQYYSTIQYADVDGDGRAELLARGGGGIQVWDLDRSRLWAGWPAGTEMTDGGNWLQPQYYSTIQCADIDGDGRAELLARGARGIVVYRFEPSTRQWVQLPDGPALSDAGGWYLPQYRSTIRCADIDGDGRAELLARGAAGIQAYKCDPTTHAWAQLPNGPELSDAAGWSNQQYYATIQYADVDGDGRAELVARGSAGIHVYRCDPASHTWSGPFYGPALSDASGWAGVHYYSTIHCADVDGDGRAELLARSGEGIQAHQFVDGAWRSLAELRAQVERESYSLLMQRPLGEGEALIYREDWFGVPAARLVASELADIGLIMPDPTGLRVGHGTGVTIYQQSGFAGPSQQILADVTHIQQTRAGKLESLQIWRDVDRPFGGRWALSTTHGYLQVDLSQQSIVLGTRLSANVSPGALFRFVNSGTTPDGRTRVQITTASGVVAFANPRSAALHLEKGQLPTPSDEGIVTLVEEPDRNGRTFALLDARDQWIALDANGQFIRTSDRNQRAIFTRAFKFADDETQVGTLQPGEVALYENAAYWGRAWISLADMSNFLEVDGLNDVVSSLRFGPETAATLYVDVGFGGARQDAVTAIPDLSSTQVGDNALSAFQVWHNIAPSKVGISSTVRLSQDYQQNGAQFTPFSAYRTVIQFPKDVLQVELWATDTVNVTINGQTYTIDEDRSATFSPNTLGRLMVLTAANGISTPGLKLRTNTMASYERCVIFPDREVHGRLAGLQDNALYEARARDNTPLVNRSTVTQEQANNVQYTITRTMATLRYDDAPGRMTPRVQAAELQTAPWALDFGKPISQPGLGDYIVDGNGDPVPPPPPNPATLVFNGPSLRQVSPDEVVQMLAQADASGGTLALGFFDDLWSGIKRAATIVVTAVRDAIVVVGKWIENTVEKIVTWVVDTAEKVATFVQGVIEKIGVAIQQFVQWLEFVFDWDDILATQRYLSDSINQGLRYFQRTVANSQGPVGRFFDQQAAKLHEQIDTVIDQLGGEPADLVRDANLPDELEWFLSRLGDNAQHTATAQPTGPSDLQTRWQAVVSSYGAVASGLLGRLDDLLAVATLLPNNPQHAVAGFLAIVRDLLDLAIQATRDTVLLLIELAATLIDELIKLLNREISIPFVSDFYHIINNGEQLTLLSLTSLLAAIPATVLGKLALGRRPFADAQPLALALDETAARDWGIVNSVCSYVNGVMAAALDPIPETNAPSFLWVFEAIGLGLSCFSWLASFPGGYPNALSFSTSSEDEIWDVTLWSYGTLLLGLDVVAFVSGNLELFKRANDVSAATKSVLSAIALVLSISANARKGESVAKGFADAIGTLPGIAAFARITEVATATEGISLGVLAGVDNLSATAGLVLSNVDA
jgi:hypothetical protein